MIFQFSPWGALFALGGGVSVFMAIKSWPQRRPSGGRMFFLLTLTLAWWQFLSALQSFLVPVAAKILCTQIQYIAVASVSPIFFLFCLDYRELNIRLKPVLRSLFLVVPVLFAGLALTNSSHHMVWTAITPASQTHLSVLIYSSGPADWFTAGYSYAFLFIATLLLFGYLAIAPVQVKRRTAWLILAAICPWVANFVYMVGWGPTGVDLTPFGFVLSMIFLSRSLFQYRLFDIAPVAFGSVFDFMTDAVIVFDLQDRVVEANPAAGLLFSVSKKDTGEALQKILEPWPEFRDRVAALIHATGTPALKIPRGEKWLETRFFNIYDKSGEIKGRYLIARDVTETKKAEEERASSMERIQLQQKALLQFTFSRASAEGDFPKAVREITETAAGVLGVERASVWLGNVKEGALHCVDLFERSRNYHGQAPVLADKRFPRYFEALGKDRVIDASDACADPRTRELKDGYLLPLGITSVLAAPLHVSGAVVGVISSEHVGPSRRWREDEIRFVGEIADAAARAYSNWEKRKIEDSCRESEERFRMLVEGAPDAIFVETENVFAYLNAAALRLFGAKSAEQLLGRPLVDRVPPDNRERCLEFLRLLNEDKDDIPLQEDVYLHLDGTPFQVEASAVPIRYREIDGAVIFARDIAERKRAEDALQASYQEKIVLLREIQSRVRNNMQIVLSLLNHQAGAFKDPAMRKAFLASRNRIKAITLVHEKLYRAEDLSRIDFADYIRSLVVHLYQVYQIDSQRIRHEFDLSPAVINVNVSIPLGIIINELVVNVLQHAFPGDRQGKIFIRLTKNEGDSHTLLIQDDGVGIPGLVNLAKVETLGFQLVGMLAEQIQGEIKIETAPGMSLAITFPDHQGEEQIAT